MVEGVASGWELVLSVVPQGSVLGPVLFIVFIDDIDEGIRSTVLKFADDTKLGARVGSEEDRKRLRQDLFKLFKWSEDWKMLFNLDKCAVMHFRFANEGMEVKLGYQLNQLGSKAASESTFKKSNTCGVSNNRLYFTFTLQGVGCAEELKGLGSYRAK